MQIICAGSDVNECNKGCNFRLTNNENEIVFSIRTMNVYSIVLDNLCNMFKKSQWSLDNSV